MSSPRLERAARRHRALGSSAARRHLWFRRPPKLSFNLGYGHNVARLRRDHWLAAETRPSLCCPSARAVCGVKATYFICQKCKGRANMKQVLPAS